MTHPRHSIIRKHLDDYEKEGAAIQEEIADITFQRNRITKNTSVRLVFGKAGRGATFEPEYWEQADASPTSLRPIVLSSPGEDAPARVPHPRTDVYVARQMSRASEIAYPGLRACLLMWLDQRQAHAERALTAWKARDAVAEAVAMLSADVEAK